MARWLFVVLVFSTLTACSKKLANRKTDPVEVSGSVTVGGHGVDDVVLNFQPTGEGAQATLPVSKGSFKGTVFPGTYTYFIAEGSNPKAYDYIPEKYKSGSMDRKMEITANQVLNIKLD